MVVQSRLIANVQETLRITARAVGGLSYVSQSVIGLLKLGDMAISRFLALEDRVPLVDPFHCCCGFEVDLLGLETACGAVDNHPSEIYQLWLKSSRI